MIDLPLLLYDPAPLLEGFEDLIGLGSLSSPVCSGAPGNASGALLRALGGIFGDPGKGFAEDVVRQCNELAKIAGVAKVFAQLLQKTPASPEAGYTKSAELPHIDMDPKEPQKRGIRLVRHYYGEGSLWLNPQKEPEHLQRLRESPDPKELQEILSSLVAPFEQVPKDYKIIYKGGLPDGLVHCAPPCAVPRLLLVVSVF